MKVNLCDKHSIKYKKWFIKIKYASFNKPILLVWLTDSQDNDIDKILTNINGELIGSSKAASLSNYILSTKNELDDSKLTRDWAKKIKGIKPKPFATYDFDKVLSLKKNINQEELEEIANFINLFNDLITTTGEAKLKKLRRKKELKAIWEYYYNTIFWPRMNNSNKFNKTKVKGYKRDTKIQSTLQKMVFEFIKRIELV